jgi:hypothetical protein
MRLRLFLGIILAAPVSIVTGVFYIIPFWLLGWHKYIGVKTSTTGNSPLGTGCAWVLNETRAPKWLLKCWANWGGHCVGSWVVLKKDPIKNTTLNHELHHVHQMHTLGFLQPIFYMFSSLTAIAAGEEGYVTNHFEIAARRAANQVTDAKSFAQGYAWCSKSHK